MTLSKFIIKTFGQILSNLRLLAIGICLCIFCQCKMDNDFCRLSKLDKEFSLIDFDSIQFIENEDSIITLYVNSEIDESWDVEMYIIKGGYEFIYSSFYLPNDRRQIWLSSSGCNESAYLAVIRDDAMSERSNFYITKDTLTNATRLVRGIEYSNCYIFNDTIDIKELVYSKDFGIVRLELLDGYKIELLQDPK